jgi:hypothetical protein
VVRESSATLGYPDEETVPLNGNHSTIVKYRTDTDDNYKVVSETLSLLLQEAISKRLIMSQNLIPVSTGTLVERGSISLD